MNPELLRSKDQMQEVAPLRAALRGRRLLAARGAWLVASALIVGLALASVPVAYADYRTVCAAGAECSPFWRIAPEDLRALGELGLSVDLYAAYKLTAEVVYMLGFWAIGAVIFWRKSDDRLALFFSLMLMALGALNFVDTSLEIHSALDLLGAFIGFLGSVSFCVSFFVFPDGRFVPRWTRWSAAILVLYLACLYFSPVDSPLNPRAWPPLLVVALVTVLLGTMLFSQIYRYLRVSGPIERQQTKWVVFGLTVAISVLIATALASVIFPVLLQPGAPKVLYALLEATVNNLLTLLIPLSIGVAILRYRLWDIDVVINRTLVYGALTTCVVGLYALVVGALGAVLQAEGGFVVSLSAAGLVAVLFQPLRYRLQRGVDRLMYGERDEPYKVLSRLGQRLKATIEPREVLPTIVETVAGALKLPYAAMAVKKGESFEVVASRGSPTESEPTVLPLVFGGETIGQLVLAPRGPGERFTPADRRLIEDLARSAEGAVYAVLLTADLQRSRERLVTAREEERRRLRRDLHDGLGPTLAGLPFGLTAVANMLSPEQKEADALLVELKAQIQVAITDVRRLVYGLRPPALDDLGLVPAIREQAAHYGPLADGSPDGAGEGAGRRGGGGPVFSVESSGELRSIPAAVEVACYRIVQEAVTNVARHARASACRIVLSGDKAASMLSIEVVDDGVGLPKERRSGVGLSSMRERTAELGGTCEVVPLPHSGGTRVVAHLPLPDEEE